MPSQLRINGSVWRKRKSKILRGFASAIADVIECETGEDKALLAAKLALMQAEFTYLVDIFEAASRRREK